MLFGSPTSILSSRKTIQPVVVKMDEEKARTSSYHEEQVAPQISEEEPYSDYKVQWRTLAAIFALAMGNVCAAMSNTVCIFFADKHSKTASNELPK